MKLHPGHFVAIVGGACAGSEAAYQLASRGIYVAVFDQQALPYGKIEDGLPKWHVKLRDKEEKKINDKIMHPYVSYIPNTRLGDDIQFDDLVENWGFSAILLASGAWRDRPLPVDGIEKHVNNGFYYQNYFVDWFNHYHEPGYNRHQCEIKDGAIVVGGGLASIDVVKILMLETTARALKERGIDVDVISLEHRGIPKKLEELGLTFDELGIEGCTLYYRRRSIDMPLSTIDRNAAPEKIAKAQQVRQKILDNAIAKYCFKFQGNSVPVAPLSDGDRLDGLVFQRSEIVDGRVKMIPDSEFEVPSPLTISSIGSIPEMISGIPSKGELFIIPDEDDGKLDGYQNVFGLGNAVTGRGNIRQSALHARLVTNGLLENHLNWSEEDHQAIEAGNLPDEATVKGRGMLSTSEIEAIQSRISAAQKQAGYHNDYERWVTENLPVRLENM